MTCSRAKTSTSAQCLPYSSMIAPCGSNFGAIFCWRYSMRQRSLVILSAPNSSAWWRSGTAELTPMRSVTHWCAASIGQCTTPGLLILMLNFSAPTGQPVIVPPAERVEPVMEILAEKRAWIPPGMADWRAFLLNRIDAVIGKATQNGAPLQEAKGGIGNRAAIAHPFPPFPPRFPGWLRPPVVPLPGGPLHPPVQAPPLG